MKIKNGISILIIGLLLVLAVFVPNIVKADNSPTPPSQNNLGTKISVGTNGISDTMVYYNLCEVYDKYYGLTGTSKIQSLYKYMFKGMDFSYFGGVLDLSSSKISTLEGLELIDFSECTNLKRVDLSNNSLNTIVASHVVGLECIEELDISNNNISSMDISSLSNLRVLDASNNSLDFVNLDFMITPNGPSYVDLSDNNIVDAEDVTFIRQGLLDNEIYLYIINDLQTDEYLSNNKIKVQSGIIGRQSDTIYASGEKLIYNKINNPQAVGLGIEDITIFIAEYDNPNTPLATYKNSEIEDKVDLLSDLNFGKYIVFFGDKDGNSIDNEVSALVDKYDAYVVDYRPAMPTVISTRDNKAVSFKSGDILTLDTTFTFDSIDEDVKYMYKIGTGEWIQADSVTIPKGNNLSLYIKSVVNGIESEVTIVVFGTNNSFSMQDMLSIGIIVLAGLALFFLLIPAVKFFMNKQISVKEKSKKKK